MLGNKKKEEKEEGKAPFFEAKKQFDLMDSLFECVDKLGETLKSSENSLGKMILNLFG